MILTQFDYVWTIQPDFVAVLAHLFVPKFNKENQTAEKNSLLESLMDC